MAEELYVVRPGERIPGPETLLPGSPCLCFAPPRHTRSWPRARSGQKPIGLRFELMPYHILPLKSVQSMLQ